MKELQPLPATSGPMMYIQENFAGYFILFLIPVKKAMRVGMIKRLTNISVAPTPGRALASTRKKGFYSLPRAHLPMIFMAGNEPAIIFLPIPCWRLILQLANVSGISKRSTMKYGIGLFLQHRCRLIIQKTGKKKK